MLNNESWQQLITNQSLPKASRLEDCGLLLVSGQEASKFLQGQLTCDVENIPNQGTLGAHCNPQGRVICLFYLYRSATNYYLLMPRKMVPIAEVALKKYAIFFRVVLTDVSEQFIYVGIQGLASHHFETMPVISLTPERHIVAVDRIEWEHILPVGHASNWKLLNISQQLPSIYPETSGKFLPHELKLPELNAIHFAKGCYTGQEIIARLHYRGKIKTGLHQGIVVTAHSLLPGTEVFVNQQNERTVAGHIIDSALIENGKQQILMVLANAYLDKQLYIAADKNDNILLLHEKKE